MWAPWNGGLNVVRGTLQGWSVEPTTQGQTTLVLCQNLCNLSRHKRMLLMSKKAHKRWEKQHHPTWWKETGETSKRTSVFNEGTSAFTILCGWKLPDVIKRTLGSAAQTSDRHTNLNTHRLLSKDQGFLHRCSATGAPDTEWKLRASPPIHHRDTEEHLDGWEELIYRKQI